MHFNEAGWNVLGFEHIPGRAADYGPGSPDLDLIVDLMKALSRIQVPAGTGPLKHAEDRWKTYTDDPADALTFAGESLAHTDWMPDNILITHDRAWLVDWAWPTLSAAWLDPASWLLRIMARGHTPAEAEAHAGRLPAYATADPDHVDLFVRANVRLWDEIEQTNGRPWAKIMARTARTWAEHRSIRVLPAQNHGDHPWAHAARTLTAARLSGPAVAAALDGFEARADAALDPGQRHMVTVFAVAARLLLASIGPADAGKDDRDAYISGSLASAEFLRSFDPPACDAVAVVTGELDLADVLAVELVKALRESVLGTADIQVPRGRASAVL